VNYERATHTIFGAGCTWISNNVTSIYTRLNKDVGYSLYIFRHYCNFLLPLFHFILQRVEAALLIVLIFALYRFAFC